MLLLLSGRQLYLFEKKIRFGFCRFVLMADIANMYRQVLVTESHHNFHCILRQCHAHWSAASETFTPLTVKEHKWSSNCSEDDWKPLMLKAKDATWAFGIYWVSQNKYYEANTAITISSSAWSHGVLKSNTDSRQDLHTRVMVIKARLG